MKHLLTGLTLFALLFSFGACSRPVKKFNKWYEQRKLADNLQNGADHDIDCEIEFRGGRPWCEIHETSDPSQCPKIAMGNRKGDEWTDCVATLRDGKLYCAEHDRYDCPSLVQSAAQLARQSDPRGPHDHSTPQCIRVQRDGVDYCSFHDTFECYKLELICKQHPGKMCGVMRPGSTRGPNQVPVEDGVIEKSMLMLKSVHTAYVWGTAVAVTRK